MNYTIGYIWPPDRFGAPCRFCCNTVMGAPGEAEAIAAFMALMRIARISWVVETPQEFCSPVTYASLQQDIASRAHIRKKVSSC